MTAPEYQMQAATAQDTVPAGLPGVDDPAAAAVRADAKPLRVKVPKSKERALIREFGLDVTTLTEEEADRRREELRALVRMGKTRGFLTQQEISDHLPGKLLDAEVLEAIVKMLDDMGIAVYEHLRTPRRCSSRPVRPPPRRRPRRPPRLRSPPSSPSSAAPPTRCACTCARWVPPTC